MLGAGISQRPGSKIPESETDVAEIFTAIARTAFSVRGQLAIAKSLLACLTLSNSVWEKFTVNDARDGYEKRRSHFRRHFSLVTWRTDTKVQIHFDKASFDGYKFWRHRIIMIKTR